MEINRIYEIFQKKEIKSENSALMQKTFEVLFGRKESLKLTKEFLAIKHIYDKRVYSNKSFTFKDLLENENTRSEAIRKK